MYVVQYDDFRFAAESDTEETFGPFVICLISSVGRVQTWESLSDSGGDSAFCKNSVASCAMDTVATDKKCSVSKPAYILGHVYI